MITVTERLGQVEWEATGDTATEAMDAFWQLRHGMKPQAGPAPTPPVVEIPDFALKACVESAIVPATSAVSIFNFHVASEFPEIDIVDLRNRMFNHLKSAFAPQEAENA
jgi:hypothetical protein